MTPEQHTSRLCPDCGPVSVRTDRIRRTHSASGAREQWPCPVCGGLFSQALADRKQHQEQPLTEDDLIAFGRDIEASEDVVEQAQQPAKEPQQ